MWETTMAGEKTKRARDTFESFLAAWPGMARDVQRWDPDDEDRHADINCTMADGSRRDFQLVEWLEAEQMQASVNRDKAEKDILGCLLAHYADPPAPLRSASLDPVSGIRRPGASSLASMVKEFGNLVEAVSVEWPRRSEWNGPQGYRCRDLTKWPTLHEYFREVHFNLYQPDPHWLMFDPVGGSYNHRQALRALLDAVLKKIRHYAPPTETPLDLIVHYSRAGIRNTPFYGADIQGLEDVAKWLAEQLPGLLRSLSPIPFQRVFLLDDRRPDPVAFAVYPTPERCS
jgi:hypothetical protein